MKMTKEECEMLNSVPPVMNYADWDEVELDHWAKILCEYPQFAEHCRWNDLNDLEWKLLLKSQPQFADKRTTKK